MTSRIRKVDKSLLDQSTVEIDLSSQFLDSDDQELFINQLTVENELQYKSSKKVLNLLILIEIPIIAYYLSSNVFDLERKTSSISFLVLSNLLTLVNSLNQTSKIRSTVLSQLFSLGLSPSSVIIKLAKNILTFNGFNYLNISVNFQIYYVCYVCWTSIKEVNEKPNTGLFIVYLLFNSLPFFNLVMLILINSWFKNMSSDLEDLSNLKYKFKSV